MASTLHDMVRQGIPPQAFGFKGAHHASTSGGSRQAPKPAPTPSKK